MGWFERVFPESSIVWLLLSTVVALVSGFISSWLYYRFIKRQEIVDQVVADINKQRVLRQEDAQAEQQERIRQEVIRWANPILGAVQDLRYRLINILEDRGYRVLNKNYQQETIPQWSISYEYLMESTLYLFAQYFAWIYLFEEELSFEIFHSHKSKDRFLDAIHGVSQALGSFPLKGGECSGVDTQIFNLQQRSIGELLIIRPESGSRYCMSYPEFAEKLHNPNFGRYIQPLVELLDGLEPDTDCRWKRLIATRDALKKLERNCRQLLQLPET